MNLNLNILKIAGSLLDLNIHIEEAKAKINKTHKGKIGENTHNFGTICSVEIKVLINFIFSE